MAQTLTTPAQTLPERFRRVTMIGVPFDLGASRRGARFGPQALRTAGLAAELESLGYALSDFGDIAVRPEESDQSGGPGHPKNVRVVRDANRELANAVEAALREDSYPIALGGDHSMAIGVLAGIARVKGPQGVIWVDAHGDLNTVASSPTGNIHGMSMAVAFGQVSDLFPPPEFPTPAADLRHSVFIGIRELDPQEKQTILEHEILCFTMSDIDQLGMPKVIELAFQRASQGPRTVHVSFDIDCLDPTLAPGTGTPVRGGLTYREAHLFMEQLWRSGIAHSLELSEVNPLLDEHNMTAKLANELICSALGKSIL
ncbi:MAG TPA: arginase [Candidatus Acidoferrales bacterium]|nr:arginase [Candidatus Acidoferrales bacterium]